MPMDFPLGRLKRRRRGFRAAKPLRCRPRGIRSSQRARSQPPPRWIARRAPSRRATAVSCTAGPSITEVGATQTLKRGVAEAVKVAAHEVQSRPLSAVLHQAAV